MAGIESLKNRIIRDDEESAENIIREANLQAQNILSEALDKSEIILKEANLQAQKDGDERKERIIARAQLDARNNILGAKQKAIGKVFEMASERIRNMGNVEYTSFIEKLLMNTIDNGDEEIIFSENDKKRIQPGSIERLNLWLVSQNRMGMLKLSHETRNINSGFVLKQGGIEIDCSVESIVRVLRESLEGEIVNLLFENM